MLFCHGSRGRYGGPSFLYSVFSFTLFFFTEKSGSTLNFASVEFLTCEDGKKVRVVLISFGIR